MENRINVLDPLGIFRGLKHDVDRIGSSLLSAPKFGPHKTIGNPVPIEFDGTLVNQKEEARSKLIGFGYSPTLVDKALTWYEEWLMGMARRMAPGDTNLQSQVVQAAYAEIAPRAEAWIRGIQEAFSVPAG